MALNMRNPLIKRPIMMAGIEGGAIFILTLLASESFGKVLQLTLIAAVIAGVAGLAIGAFEKATVNTSKYQPPTKREKAKAQKKKEAEKAEKPTAPVPAASTPADASKTKSWAERAIESAEGGPAPAIAGAPSDQSPGQPLLPTVSTSAEIPITSPPSQSMLPSMPASVGADPPPTPETAAPSPATSPAQPAGTPQFESPQEDDESQAAALLSQLMGSDEPTPPPPAASAAVASAPPPAPAQGSSGEVGLTAAIIQPDEELRSHIRDQLRAAGFKITVEKDEFQSGLVALLEQQPDLIITAAPPLAEDYFQNVRRACQYGVIVLYGDEDPAGIDQVTGVWRPWTPLNVEELKAALGLPS